MDVGIVGLSGLGGRLAVRAAEQNVRVVGLDETQPPSEVIDSGAQIVETLAAMRSKLLPPRVILLDVSNVDVWLEHLAPYVDAGDIVGDLGPGHWQDSLRRRASLQTHGVAFVDVGVLPQRGSKRVGAMLVGGERAAVERLRSLLASICVPGGFVHAGPGGAGHFARAVFDGVHAAFARAFGEGVELLKHFHAPLDIDAIVDVSMRALVSNGSMKIVATRGMNRLVIDALDLHVVAPVIAQAIIGGAADRAPEEKVAERLNAKQIIELIACKDYDPRLRGIVGTYGVDIEGVGFWVIDVNDGHYRVREGREHVSCLLAGPEDEMVSVMLGEDNAVTAVMRGALRLEGDLVMAQRFVGLPRSRGVHGYLEMS